MPTFPKPIQMPRDGPLVSGNTVYVKDSAAPKRLISMAREVNNLPPEFLNYEPDPKDSLAPIRKPTPRITAPLLQKPEKSVEIATSSAVTIQNPPPTTYLQKHEQRLRNLAEQEKQRMQNLLNPSHPYVEQEVFKAKDYTPEERLELVKKRCRLDVRGLLDYEKQPMISQFFYNNARYPYPSQRTTCPLFVSYERKLATKRCGGPQATTDAERAAQRKANPYRPTIYRSPPRTPKKPSTAASSRRALDTPSSGSEESSVEESQTEPEESPEKSVEKSQTESEESPEKQKKTDGKGSISRERYKLRHRSTDKSDGQESGNERKALATKPRSRSTAGAVKPAKKEPRKVKQPNPVNWKKLDVPDFDDRTFISVDHSGRPPKKLNEGSVRTGVGATQSLTTEDEEDAAPEPQIAKKRPKSGSDKTEGKNNDG